MIENEICYYTLYRILIIMYLFRLIDLTSLQLLSFILIISYRMLLTCTLNV